jgi:hypothetical protein
MEIEKWRNGKMRKKRERNEKKSGHESEKED